MKRSQSLFAGTSATNASIAAGSRGAPFSSNASSQKGKPAAVSAIVVLLSSLLDRGDGPHQVDQAGALEVALAAERGGAGEEDPLDLLGALDELAADRQERRNRPGDVRGRHAGAGVVEVAWQVAGPVAAICLQLLGR